MNKLAKKIFNSSIKKKAIIGEKSKKQFFKPILFSKFLIGTKKSSVSSYRTLEKEFFPPIITIHDIMHRANIKNSIKQRKKSIALASTLTI